MTASCRKRVRGAEDDCDECMPISKRINGLHIRPEDQSLVTKGMLDNSILDASNLGVVSPLLVGQPQLTDANGRMPFPVPNYPSCGVEFPPTTNTVCSLLPRHPLQVDTQLPDTMGTNTCETIASPEIAQHNVNPFDVDLEKYEPEMDSSDNPHYYNINKLLFDAHLERSHRRLGMPPS